MTFVPSPSIWIDPLLDGLEYHRKQWYYHPVYQATLKAKDPHVWEQFWLDQPKWDEIKDEDGEIKEISPALLALRSCVYAASKHPNGLHSQSLVKALNEKILPSEPLDIWSSPYFRFQFLKNLIPEKSDQSQALLKATVDQWPWLWGFASIYPEEHYYQLAYLLLKNENTEIFEYLQNKLEAEHWIVPTSFDHARAIFKDRVHWHQDDPQWIENILAYDPRLGMFDGKSGKDILVQAAIEHKIEIFSKLLDLGFKPQPEKSFGLGPAHWAVNGLSETSWDGQAQRAYPKEPAAIEKQAKALGVMLSRLEQLGFSPDEKVAKVSKSNFRRPSNLVKVGLSAWDALEKRLESQSKNIQPSTFALVKQSYLSVAQPEVRPSVGSSRRL